MYLLTLTPKKLLRKESSLPKTFPVILRLV